MKHISLIVLSILLTNKIEAQILNSEFNNWTTIYSTGQPYLDLTYWSTNNEGLDNGFATSPNLRIEEGNDTGVSITSAYKGIDGLYSGVISQTISTDRLLDIEYLAKCDSIFKKGSCVVNLYNDNQDLVFTDSIKIKELDYTTKSIALSNIPNLRSNNITVEFKAFGQLGQWEPFQAYSEFNLLKVEANYTSNTYSIQSTPIKIFPNPFDSNITICTEGEQTISYKIINLQGQVLSKGFGNSINTSQINPGVYVILIQSNEQTTAKKITKH